MTNIIDYIRLPAVFEPEVVTAMGSAYERALASFDTLPEKTVREVIAGHIIGLEKRQACSARKRLRRSVCAANPSRRTNPPASLLFKLLPPPGETPMDQLADAATMRQWAQRCFTKAEEFKDKEERTRLYKMGVALLEVAETRDWLEGHKSELTGRKPLA